MHKGYECMFACDRVQEPRFKPIVLRMLLIITCVTLNSFPEPLFV